MERTQAFFVEQGVWIRPFGKLIYIMPPYICSDDELLRLCGSIVALLESGDFEFLLSGE